MPVPASPRPAQATGNFQRSFTDPLGRAYTGRVTIKRLTEPFLSVEATLDASGSISLSLTPGTYSLGAMLRDPSNTRAYIAEEFTV